MENVKLFSMSNVNPYFQYLYECNVDVLKDMLECVRCHRFTRNDFSICSLTLSLSLSMSSVAPCVNNCPEKSISFSFVPCSAESTLLIVPVVLHHQRNICCKTWHKKPVTEVCISCHILYWQFYHQWTDESWCVAPACCLHTVVPGIVCDSRDIVVTTVVVHTAVTKSVVPRSIGGWEWTETDRSVSTT